MTTGSSSNHKTVDDVINSEVLAARIVALSAGFTTSTAEKIRMKRRTV